jgi:uncharacterized protein YneR
MASVVTSNTVSGNQKFNQIKLCVKLGGEQLKSGYSMSIAAVPVRYFTAQE